MISPTPAAAQSAALLHACRVRLRKEASQLAGEDRLTAARTCTLHTSCSRLQGLMEDATWGPEAGGSRAMPDLVAVSEVGLQSSGSVQGSGGYKRRAGISARCRGIPRRHVVQCHHPESVFRLRSHAWHEFRQLMPCRDCWRQSERGHRGFVLTGAGCSAGDDVHRITDTCGESSSTHQTIGGL